MSMPLERPIHHPDPSAIALPLPEEHLEMQWFDSGIFNVHRTSFPPPPSSRASTAPPIGDHLADDWFR